MTQTPERLAVAPAVVKWTRAPAHREGPWIVMDMTKATEYSPTDAIRLPQQLARIQTEADALDFVGRFGLLGTIGIPGLAMPQPPIRDRQQFGTFQRAAEWLRGIGVVRLHLNRIVRHLDRAANGHHDRRGESYRWLREWSRVAPHPSFHMLTEHLRANEDSPTGEPMVLDLPDEMSAPLLDGTWTLQYRHERASWMKADDAAFLRHVSKWIADVLSVGLTGFITRVISSETEEPGTLRYGLTATQSLLTVAFFHLANSFVQKEELRLCERLTCRSPFVVEDRRMRFCSPVCGDRSRQEKYRQEKRRLRKKQSTTQQRGQRRKRAR